MLTFDEIEINKQCEIGLSSVYHVVLHQLGEL